MRRRGRKHPPAAPQRAIFPVPRLSGSSYQARRAAHDRACTATDSGIIGDASSPNSCRQSDNRADRSRIPDACQAVLEKAIRAAYVRASIVTYTAIAPDWEPAGIPPGGTGPPGRCLAPRYCRTLPRRRVREPQPAANDGRPGRQDVSDAGGVMPQPCGSSVDRDADSVEARRVGRAPRLRLT